MLQLEWLERRCCLSGNWAAREIGHLYWIIRNTRAG